MGPEAEVNITYLERIELFCRQTGVFNNNFFPQQIRTYGKLQSPYSIPATITSWLTLFFFPADKVVKVPQMAESISEGTLKQWVKSK